MKRRGGQSGGDGGGVVSRPSKTVVRAARDPFDAFQGVKLIVFAYDGERRWAADPLVMRERDPATRVEPTLRLEDDEAQALMDALWDVGLRPTQGKGSAGQMEATRAHLEDMRRLVFTPKVDP